jgi:hypothetical protein
MTSLIATVAGAVDFNTTIDFEAAVFVDLSARMNDTFVIYNIGYANDGAAHAFHCWLQLPGGAATERLDIINEANETGFSDLGCRIPVPRTAAAAWQLRFTTTGKAAAGTFVVNVQLVPIEIPT